jgi:hypothetical protein
VFIPHVNANYRLVIYPTEADANANNTASALVNIPDVAALSAGTLEGGAIPYVFDSEDDPALGGEAVNLLNADLTVGDYAITAGKDSPGDGYGHSWQIVASGGDITLDNGNEAKRISVVTTSTGTQTVATALDNRLVSQTAEDVAGTAALVDTGTAAGEVPLNSSLVPKAGGDFDGDISAPKITASTGILFGTDTAAANTLDDYETGTWTPTTPSAANMSSLSIIASEYTTIGNMVFAELKGSFSVTSASSVRTLFVFTLPFNTENNFTVIGGGGLVRSSSNLELNPAIGDPSSSSNTQAFLTFISCSRPSREYQVRALG